MTDTTTRTVIVGHIEPREGEHAGNTPRGGTTTSDVNGIEWVELVLITPEVAADWKMRYRFEGQRPLRDSRVNRLELALMDNNFSTSEMRIVHIGDRGYLTNGQHRCEVVIRTGKSILVTVLHKIGHSIEDVIADYNHCDTMPVRTDAEQLAATGLPGATGLSPHAFNQLSKAVMPIIGGFVGRAYGSSSDPYLKSMDVRREVIPDFADAALRFYEIVTGCDGVLTRRLKNRAIMSVALVTLQEQPVKAAQFWKAVAENNGLLRGDPCYSLVRFLLTAPFKSNQGAHTSRSAAAAWNAFYKGQSASNLRVHDVMKPIMIRGTEHYKGKSVYLPYHREEA